MDEIADISMMQELLNKPEGISAVEKLLNEFEAHEAKEENTLEACRGPGPIKAALQGCGQ